jgi:hypothetical protein
LFDIVLPNLVEPVTNSTEELIVCTTNVKAFIVLVTVKEPVITVLPDTETTPLFTTSIGVAVAAFAVPSDKRTLPVTGFDIVLNPVPEEPDDPDDPVDPDDPLLPEVPDDPLEPVEPDEPLVPEVPVEPDDPVEPEEPEEPVVPDVPDVPLVPDDPLVPEVPDEPVEPELPLEPDVPEEPLAPLVPEEPDVPVEPLDPDEPEVPVVPLVPVVPDVPEVPLDPRVPEVPLVPDVPTEISSNNAIVPFLLGPLYNRGVSIVRFVYTNSKVCAPAPVPVRKNTLPVLAPIEVNPTPPTL